MKGECLAEQTRLEIRRLSCAGLDSRTFRLEALKQLSKVLPSDAFWWATCDPTTLLFARAVMEGIPQHVVPRFFANEFLQEDVNKFVQLARHRKPVNSLYAATFGNPLSSPRYREILVPLRMGDELRAALVVDGACWGFMCLHRELSGPGFTDTEIAFLGRLVPHLATALRTSLVLDEYASGLRWPGPGLLVLNDSLSVVAMTPAAEHWLEEIDDWPREKGLPQAVCAVVVRLCALEERAESTQVAVAQRVQIRTRSGHWLSLHASRLSGPGAHRRIAVVLDLARPVETASLILRAYGLTPREAAVARLVLPGLSTEEIAETLHISPLTVQQHLKVIFEKFSVHSRRELTARIFSRYYLTLSHHRVAVDRFPAGDLTGPG